jgi:hypothetical protein
VLRIEQLFTTHRLDQLLQSLLPLEYGRCLKSSPSIHKRSKAYRTGSPFTFVQADDLAIKDHILNWQLGESLSQRRIAASWNCGKSVCIRCSVGTPPLGSRRASTRRCSRDGRTVL